METDNLTLSPEAVSAIEHLQHRCGTYDFYALTLSRLFNLILYQGDEIGMDDLEAIRTLRVLRSLMDDLANIAGKHSAPATSDDDDDEVEHTFAGVDLPEPGTEATPAN